MNINILIVDDEPDVLTATTLALSSMRRRCGQDPYFGYQANVITVDSAVAAIEVMKTGVKIAVAVIDMVMEEDHSGLKLMEEIRGRFNDHEIEIILRTGQEGISDLAYLGEIDLGGILPKADTTNAILRTVVASAVKRYINKSFIQIASLIIETTNKYSGPELVRKLEDSFIGNAGIMTSMPSIRTGSKIIIHGKSTVSGSYNENEQHLTFVTENITYKTNTLTKPTKSVSRLLQFSIDYASSKCQ